jgi:hypothetical protein
MDDKTRNHLDRLLADGELSGPEAQAIFERVYADVEREERPRHSARRALWLGGYAAIACFVTVVAMRSSSEQRQGLTARGQGAAAPILEMSCSGGTLGTCPASSNLVFLVSGDSSAGYLSAYAEPLDPDLDRVWYFSQETGSPELGAAEGTQVFERGVRLRGSHRAGRYRVHAFVADWPLTRAQMLGEPDRNSEGTVRTSMHAELVIVDE